MILIISSLFKSIRPRISNYIKERLKTLKVEDMLYSSDVQFVGIVINFLNDLEWSNFSMM